MLSLILLCAPLVLANPFGFPITLAPRQDPTPTSAPVTTAPGLTCTDGSTVVFTTACTVGTPISYCSSEQPLPTCPPGSFPGTYHPGHCETATTCYPTDAYFLTPSCSNGGVTYSTETLYTGTLADQTTATTITNVECSCTTDAYYTWVETAAPTVVDSLDTFCLPLSSCPPDFTSSISTNLYCQTATTDPYCTGKPTTTAYCNCPSGSTAVYPTSGNTATATGCATFTGYTSV